MISLHLLFHSILATSFSLDFFWPVSFVELQSFWVCSFLVLVMEFHLSHWHSLICALLAVIFCKIHICTDYKIELTLKIQNERKKKLQGKKRTLTWCFRLCLDLNFHFHHLNCWTRYDDVFLMIFLSTHCDCHRDCNVYQTIL